MLAIQIREGYQKTFTPSSRAVTSCGVDHATWKMSMKLAGAPKGLSQERWSRHFRGTSSSRLWDRKVPLAFLVVPCLALWSTGGEKDQVGRLGDAVEIKLAVSLAVAH